MTTRAINVRRISRFVVQSASSRFADIVVENSSRQASASRSVACSRVSVCNSASLDSALANRWRARLMRGSNSLRVNTPSVYASINLFTDRCAVVICFFSDCSLEELSGADKRRSYSLRSNFGLRSNSQASSHTARSSLSVRICLFWQIRFPPKRYASVPMHR